MGLTYKDSGVDTEKGDAFVDEIIPLAKSTYSKRVLEGIGGFGALYSGSFPECKDPVLVSGTDGVGTKLKIAQDMNIHDTIGIDAVAMCVNDIITSGAKPLFFLDYISCGKIRKNILVDIVKGIVAGCRLADCSLIGGETAEHPGVMKDDDYDIAGFAVGVVDREKIIDGKNIAPGDVIIGLPSSGVHSNGFSLVRKLFFEIKKYDYDKKFADLQDTLGKTLLTPTRIYTKSVTSLSGTVSIKGIVHITGGGFYGNVPRMLPPHVTAKIDRSGFEIPPVFNLIRKEGNIDDREMFSVFNMGIGLMMVVDKTDCGRALEVLKKSGENPAVIGEVDKFNKESVILF